MRRAMPKSARKIRRSSESGSASRMLAGLTSRCSSPADARNPAPGHRGEDLQRLTGGSPPGSARAPAGRIDALDVVHRDPQLAVVFAAVVHAEDVGMRQLAAVGLTQKPGPILRVGSQFRRAPSRRPGAATADASQITEPMPPAPSFRTMVYPATPHRPPAAWADRTSQPLPRPTDW